MEGKPFLPICICSMYGIFTYVWLKISGKGRSIFPSPLGESLGYKWNGNLIVVFCCLAHFFNLFSKKFPTGPIEWTPKKPEYLIARIATYGTGSVGIRSHSIFDGFLTRGSGPPPPEVRKSQPPWTMNVNFYINALHPDGGFFFIFFTVDG